MKYQVLSSKAVKIFKEMQEFDRSEWKFKEITRPQASFLVLHITLEDLLSIDRGVASLLMDCIFKLLDQDEEITDANVLGELHKVVKHSN